MKIKAIINEMTFGMYQGLIRVNHTDEISASEVADFVRAMPGVTRVTAVDSNEDTNTVVLKVKILSGKPGTVVFEKLKKDTFKLVPNIKRVDLSLKSVEKIK
jgi:carbon monoxide dehydrogenase subunit G